MFNNEEKDDFKGFSQERKFYKSFFLLLTRIIADFFLVIHAW